MARYYWQNERNAIGKRLGYGRDKGDFPLEIVGVVKDSKDTSLRDEIPGSSTRPTSRSPISTEMTFFVRTLADAAGVTAAVRDAIRALDPRAPDLRREDDGGAGERVAVRRADGGVRCRRRSARSRRCSRRSASTA